MAGTSPTRSGLRIQPIPDRHDPLLMRTRPYGMPSIPTLSSKLFNSDKECFHSTQCYFGTDCAKLSRAPAGTSTPSCSTTLTMRSSSSIAARNKWKPIAGYRRNLSLTNEAPCFKPVADPRRSSETAPPSNSSSFHL